jgi:hypothetical protein
LLVAGVGTLTPTIGVAALLIVGGAALGAVRAG